MSHSECSVRYWDHLSAREIEQAALEEHSCIIIPIGVIEAHGPLLPVGFDAMMAGVVAHVVAERIQKSGARPVVFNCVPYSGIVGATQGLAGTIGYPAMLSTEILFVTLQWLFAHGFERFFIINGDAGTGKSLMSILYHATKERQEFFFERDGAISLFTWFDGIDNVGHASVVEHGFYTYLCEHSDPHTRNVAFQFGIKTPLNEECLKDLDGVKRVYPKPRREFTSWLSIEGQSRVYGVSYFSYGEYRAFLDSGRVHPLWEQQLTRIVRDILGILDM
ncbi:MAG: creatinine amidohydrolase [Parcubacteria group bacterium Gr01-1014_29]|nr:MAG: creatinine amidohydrolase [Parcubacteria group bacterium Gr01-1014_29]